MRHTGAVTVLVWLDDDDALDRAVTGTKFASLAAVRRWPAPDRPEIPSAGALTTAAWHRVVEHNDLGELAARAAAGQPDAEQSLGRALGGAELPDEVAIALSALAARLTSNGAALAVRSSAVAEDLAGRTFAGQYLTRLSVRTEQAVADAYRACLASAWSAGPRCYRERTADGSPDDPAMAVIVQEMAHDGDGWAGAAVTDGQGGVTVEVVRGLGAELMSGRADPLRWIVAGGAQPEGDLARAVVDWCRRAERRCGNAVEVEFAVRSDGPTPVVLQLRAHRAGVPVVGGPGRWASPPGDVSGLAIGSGTVRGPACVLDGPEDSDRLVPGGVLVTTSTDPAWLPLLGGLGAVVTDHGGLTSHAAIVCRELGILAVVGCGDATRRLVDGRQVEVRCDGPNGTVSAIS